MKRYILYYSLFSIEIINAFHFHMSLSSYNRREFVKLTSGVASGFIIGSNNYDNICVIGANGETGRECLKILDKNKKKTKAISRKPLDYKELEIENKDLIQNINIDIKDKYKLGQVLKDVSSVIFLANAKKKRKYYKSDFEDFQNYEDIDIYALKNVVNNCIQYKIPKLVYVSASCRSCNENVGSKIDKICGLECEHCNTKQLAEKIIRNSYENQKDIDYTIVRVGSLINSQNRGPSEIEINQDYTKSGMISRIDLANICLNSLENENTSRTTFEAYYRDTTQPYDVKESLKKCREQGKSVEECFFGSSFKDTKPKNLDDVLKTPIKGSLFTTGNEYDGETWQDLFKDLQKDKKISVEESSPEPISNIQNI